MGSGTKIVVGFGHQKVGFSLESGSGMRFKYAPKNLGFLLGYEFFGYPNPSLYSYIIVWPVMLSYSLTMAECGVVLLLLVFGSSWNFFAMAAPSKLTSQTFNTKTYTAVNSKGDSDEVWYPNKIKPNPEKPKNRYLPWKPKDCNPKSIWTLEVELEPKPKFYYLPDFITILFQKVITHIEFQWCHQICLYLTC